ncbi:daptide-type RiPP biosynthesis methyltransferase [Williamsia sp. MIQD14]|uniref:daptide-type RiPP biosynthesis methyltransferase n=1 Tax=Williamsia sp. MIQD14 TaxID=3425703 RepID=UPI003D9FD1FD
MTVTDIDAIPDFARADLAGSGKRVRLRDLYHDDFGADLYDDIGFSNTSEVFEILSAIKGHPGPVLELAAGSGRVTVPMVAGGRDVTAVDLSDTMLTLLRRRLDAAPRLRGTARLVQGDMATHAEPEKSVAAAVIATTSISLLTDDARRGMWRNLFGQLLSGGVLVVSTVELDAEHAGGDAIARTRAEGAGGRHVRMIESWPAAATERVVVMYDEDQLTGPGDTVEVCVTRIGVVPADVVTAELAEVGFTIRRTRVVTTPDGRHRYLVIEAVTP